ncbi:MAG TPA: hypothetical protein VGR16_00735 [Thermomicrobiales bacterium]|nr:hypothetical protein [Thermomicrobiales bacterium]
MIRQVISIRGDVMPEISSEADIEVGERVTRRDRPGQTPAPARTAVAASTSRTTIRAMLHSREGLRQALLLQEILGPPKSQR